MYKLSSWGDQTFMESLEIAIRPSVINKEEDARLSSAWLPASELLESKPK